MLYYYHQGKKHESAGLYLTAKLCYRKSGKLGYTKAQYRLAKLYYSKKLLTDFEKKKLSKQSHKMYERNAYFWFLVASNSRHTYSINCLNNYAWNNLTSTDIQAIQIDAVNFINGDDSIAIIY